jgi:hypothetical protein
MLQVDNWAIREVIEEITIDSSSSSSSPLEAGARKTYAILTNLFKSR